ncbi:hypothetical protein KKG22_01560 [Patescibacteria group bacterium]|nr:hypothetical protein [Patescibacteria group bacterium]MBU1721782.1 hypothetical protein [Patescibacteria group bacterium]MBU1901379.1 hypothetical protein [Patescibacteria group bacterium]
MSITLGTLTFDLNTVIEFFNTASTASIIWALFSIGGYLILMYLLLYVGIGYYQGYREDKATANWKYVLLAVDVPPMNAQTPKAVELMFAQLAGAFDSPDIAGKYRGGYKQRWFSFEIISVEGYIQFLIWTEEAFRDLVEAAMYAQYPDAEVIEVEDYVTNTPDTFPHESYDMWAADFGLAEDNAYPIRNYHDFEHNISKDTILKDPMSAFLESFSRIGPGEQMWFQILIEPISNSWKEDAIKKIKEVIGEKVSAKGPNIFATYLVDKPIALVAELANHIMGAENSESSSGDEKSGDKNEMKYMTPGQMKVVELMEEKISKIGFKTKMRGLYLARKEVFKPERGVNALVGAINQFNSPTANSIVPKFGVSASYFFSGSRSQEKKNLLMKAYKKRKIKPGANSCVLNIQELATIWHFPMVHVKTPLIQKVEAKQSTPPVGLPMEHIAPAFDAIVAAPVIKSDTPKEKTTQTDAYGYDSGMKFG